MDPVNRGPWIGAEVQGNLCPGTCSLEAGTPLILLRRRITGDVFCSLLVSEMEGEAALIGGSHPNYQQQ